MHGQNFFETFAPTAKLASVRMLMQVSVQENLTLHQMDVKTAYLHAPLDCEIYVDIPDGFKQAGYCWRLNKSLYGLKQSGRNWNKIIHQYFLQAGFVVSDVDPCVYVKIDNGAKTIILLWVDDLIVGCNSLPVLNDVKSSMMQHFQMKDFGPISYFLVFQFPKLMDLLNSNSPSISANCWKNSVFRTVDPVALLVKLHPLMIGSPSNILSIFGKWSVVSFMSWCSPDQI